METVEKKVWVPLNENDEGWIVDQTAGKRLLFSNNLEVMGISRDVRIDLRLAMDLCFKGGIDHLHLQASDEGFENNESSMIVGHDEQGNAFGGFASGKSVTQKKDNFDLFPGMPKDMAKSCLGLTFNQELLREEVMRSKGGMRSPQEWVKVMDREIKKGVERVAIPFLMKPQKEDIYLSIGLFSTESLMNYQHSAIFNLALALGIQNFVDCLKYTAKRKINMPVRSRLGNVMGVEFVNAARWYFQAKLNKLVDVVPEDDGDTIE